MHVNVGLRFRVLSRKNRRIRHEISHDGISKIKPMDFNEQKNMLETTIIKAPIFITISLSSMKKSSLKTY